MPLEFQNVDVKFNQGLSMKTTPKGVIAGKWQRLENLGLTKDFYLQRRDGIGPLAPGLNGNGLAAHDASLLAISGENAFSVSTATNPATGINVAGVLGFAEIQKTEIQTQNGTQDACDVASGGGYTCYVWRQNIAGAMTIRLTLLDESTGARLLDNRILLSSATCAWPRVVYLSSPSSFMIFYSDNTAPNNLYGRCITLSAPTVVGAQTTLLSGAPGCTDACALSATTAVIAYRFADGVHAIEASYFVNSANAPSISHTQANVLLEASQPTAGIGAISICIFSSTLLAVYSNGTNGLFGTTLDATGAIVTSATGIAPIPTGMAGGATDGAGCTAVLFQGNQVIYYDNRGFAQTNLLTDIRQATVTPIMGSGGTGIIIRSACFDYSSSVPKAPLGPFIYGKAFVSTAPGPLLPVMVLDPGAPGAGAAASNPRTLGQQSSIFVLDQIGNVVARALVGAYTGVQGKATPCSTPVNTAQTGTFFTVPENTTAHFFDNAPDNPSGLCRLDIFPRVTTGPIAPQLSGSTNFSGGAIGQFDGSQLIEQGFNLFPEGYRVVANGSGGAMDVGVHQVVMVYEWTDGAGERHQSAPGLATSVTTILNDSLTITTPTLLLSQKSGVRLVPYMTAAAGNIFYRANAQSNPFLNTTGATTVGVTTGQSDANLTGNELLYNQPNQSTGVLANDPPPPSAILGVSQKRLWGFNGDGAKGQVFYSQQYQKGVGLQFSNELTDVVPMEAGAGVAVAPLDDKTVLLCANKPCVIFGAGPNPDGTNNGFSAPQTIQSDVGCSEARSVLSMPLGLIFKSLKGWYLLGRDLSVKYIGEAVAAYDAQNVSSATLLKDRQECRFTTTSGATLVYSYLVDQWSATTAKSLPSTTYSVASALYWDTLKAFVSISTTQGLNIDTPGQFFDNINNAGDVLVVTTARTAWLKLQSLNGFQRAQWLYLTMTQDPANVDQVSSTFSLVVDYDDFDTQAAPGAYTDTLFSAGAIPIAPGQSTVDIRTRLRRQKCKSVAFTFIETPTDVTGTLLGMQALTLRIGQKQGTNKLASTNTAA